MESSRVGLGVTSNGTLLTDNMTDVFGVPLSIAMQPGGGGPTPPPPKPSTQIESLSARNVYEIKWPNILRVDQVVRPTGLVDPVVEVRPATHQVDDVLQEIRIRVDKQERVLITTLTKRYNEMLTSR